MLVSHLYRLNAAKFVAAVILLFGCCTYSLSQHEIYLDSLCSYYLEDEEVKNLCANQDIFSNKISLAIKCDSLGQLFLNSARYVEATLLYTISIDIWKKKNRPKNLGKSLILLGRSHYRLGNVYESFRYVNEGLLIAQEEEDTEMEGVGHLYLSWNYWRISQCDESLNQLSQLKKLIDANKVSGEQIGNYYNARAKFEQCIGNNDMALVMSDSAIHFARENDLHRLESVAMSNKVNYMYDEDSYDLKFDLLEKSIAINKDMNDKEQLGSNLGFLANLYWQVGSYKESLKYGLQSLEITSEINDKPRMHLAHIICRKAYVGLEDYSNAYFHERAASEIGEQIYGLQYLDRVFDLQKAKDKAEQDQKLMQIASEKELERLKVLQERRIFAIVLGSLILVLIGGVFSWWSYKRNKERETQLVKEVLENEMRELELQSLRALMNPHFIFNSLNSIKGFIIRNESSVAADYLNKFSHLIRLILSNSQKKTISFTEELRSLEIYIQLEGLRLEGKFEYQINIDEGINTNEIQVAPMIIQPFVENAIWHGLMNKQGPKKLNIDIRKSSEHLEIIIRDNGIGRHASKRNQPKKGIKKQSYGMKITENRIRFAQQKNKVIVNDLVDANNEPLGTEVVIQINTKRNVGKV